MTERIKLTEDRVNYESEYQGHREVALLKFPLTKEEWKQILENQEKAEKYNKQKHLILSREEFDNHSKLIQQNNLLKEHVKLQTPKLKLILEGVKRKELEIKQLREDLIKTNNKLISRNEALIKRNDKLIEVLREVDNLKQKLDDIKKVVMQPLSSLAVAQLRRNLIKEILEKK